MDMLLPDIPVPPRRFEVTVTVPRGGDGLLVPDGVPCGDGIVCAVTARQLAVSVTVDAASMPDAAAAGIAAAGDWAMMPGARAEVKPVVPQQIAPDPQRVDLSRLHRIRGTGVREAEGG